MLDGPWHLTKAVSTHHCVPHAWAMQRCFPFSSCPYTLLEGVYWYTKMSTAVVGNFPTSSIAKMPGPWPPLSLLGCSSYMQERAMALKPCSRAHHCLG